MNAPVPPCAGQWSLFDSLLDTDHRKARGLCAECPMLEDCERRLHQARAATVSKGHPLGKYGPSGTWAGRLVGGPRGGVRNPLELAAEERMFTEDEARRAHAAYARGDRDPRAKVGERVYQRRHKRVTSKGKAEA